MPAAGPEPVGHPGELPGRPPPRRPMRHPLRPGGPYPLPGLPLGIGLPLQVLGALLRLIGHLLQALDLPLDGVDGADAGHGGGAAGGEAAPPSPLWDPPGSGRKRSGSGRSRRPPCLHPFLLLLLLLLLLPSTDLGRRSAGQRTRTPRQGGARSPPPQMEHRVLPWAGGMVLGTQGYCPYPEGKMHNGFRTGHTDPPNPGHGACRTPRQMHGLHCQGTWHPRQGTQCPP